MLRTENVNGRSVDLSPLLQGNLVTMTLVEEHLEFVCAQQPNSSRDTDQKTLRVMQCYMINTQTRIAEYRIAAQNAELTPINCSRCEANWTMSDIVGLMGSVDLGKPTFGSRTKRNLRVSSIWDPADTGWDINTNLAMLYTLHGCMGATLIVEEPLLVVRPKYYCNSVRLT